jgi:hypothetical protein
MDIPNFKDILGKLSFLKNNSSLLMPVAIGLVGGLLLIPTRFLSGGLKSKMKSESISGRALSLEALNRDPVARDQWKVQQQHQEVWAADANKISFIAMQGTKRELLSYQVFLDPNSSSMLTFEQFGQRFRGGIDAMISAAHARDCPTKEEIQRSMPESEVGTTSTTSTLGGRRPRLYSPPQPINRSGITSSVRDPLQEAQDAIVDEICRAKAASASIYANPTSLSGYEYWRDYKYSSTPEAVKDCWYYQLAYWIMEDVFDTIGFVNKGSESVFTSPVKRVIGISFGSREASGGGRTGGGDEVSSARPVYVLTIDGGLTEPWTSRVCNDNIDVVHFRVRVVVSAKSILPFMKELCGAKEHKFRGFRATEQERVLSHNLITILESTTWPVDRSVGSHLYYRYGEDAVVELDLICEYVLDKEGYAEIKPASVVKESKLKPETLQMQVY